MVLGLVSVVVKKIPQSVNVN